jgi:tungstate transport system substrate-binding protein
MRRRTSSDFRSLQDFGSLPIVGLILLLAGCSSPPAAPSITLATTTSAQDSGVLDMLVPAFRAQNGIEVKVVAVGTGQAIQLARRGDADILLVHDPAAEEKFMADGFGVNRRPLMYNDFVLLGPATDPAGVKGEKSVAAVFARIAEHKATFISRGDESGTHVKEKSIWKKAGVEPSGDWYVRAGAGMGQVLRMASEKKAYTLSDRGTFLSQRQQLDLTILREHDPPLLNHYHVIEINPEKYPHVHSKEARQFADFLVSPATQKRIGEFGVEKFGQPLFFPGEPPGDK